MPFETTSINGAWIHSPNKHEDHRGSFQEQFKLSLIHDELERDFQVKQVNSSTSAKGVVRGIHSTTGPVGQAKYVWCSTGRIWDVFVDLRMQSPTFGQWGSVELSDENGLSVFLDEGLGHAFLSLEDGSVVNYLCSSEYDRSTEVTLHPFSDGLAIDFKSIGSKNGITNFTLSHKDSVARRF